jgi:methyl-accepting chemotaxis protein
MANPTFSTIDLNKTAADVNNALKEGAYIAVGLGVLGFQRAQVRRVELAKQLEAQRAELAKQLDAQRHQFSRLPTALSSQFENYSQTARSQGDATRAQVTDQLNLLSKNLEETIGPAVQRLAGLVQADALQRSDLSEQLKDTTQVIEDRLETLRAQLTELARALDEWLQPARRQLDEQLDRLEERLPAGAREVFQSVRAAGGAQEQAFRSSIGLD